MNKKYFEFVKKIKEYGTIIIHRHSRPDGDALGSQIGLKEAILATFPYKKVYVVGDTNDKFKFLGEMDNISDEIYKQALVIVLDCGDEFLVCDERFKAGKYTMRVDHHILKGQWTDFQIIEPNEVSCASIIAKIVFECNLKLSSLGAEALYTGIVTDSGRFRYEGTNSALFELVSKLLKIDFDLFEIYNNIYIEDLNVVKLRALLTSKFIISKGGVAYLVNTQEDIKNYNTDIFTISRGMVGIMGGIRGIDVWANFTEDENGKILCEIRSNKYNINPVAARYGGGGHKQASGCTLKGYEEIEFVVRDLEKVLENKDA